MVCFSQCTYEPFFVNFCFCAKDVRVVEQGLCSVLDRVEQLDACIPQARNVQTWHNEILIRSMTRYDDKYEQITVKNYYVYNDE